MIARISAPARDLARSWQQAAARSETAHRPWPLPERRWLMGQTWLDLLFAHWRVDADLLRQVVPPQLPLDTIDGSAWIGVTPFEVRALRGRLTLPMPLVSDFPELNVRTYVTVGGKPGIYFLSLDAASRLAVIAARRSYRFPYFQAEMHIERASGNVRYRSRRRDASGPPAELFAVYSPTDAAYNPAPDTIASALTERYCAYTLDSSGTVLRAEIHHRPWSVHDATADFEVNTMAAPFGIQLEGKPLLHLAPRQDVIIWAHERAEG